ncbi:MAG: hypothetical protein H6662_09025 [Ardenticatenaceae bacterium]|nr:hypothetical protein [Anaerolineales bacterium]MCB8921712.1 hypothetical protein [Ardenticatenaceae bacterium]MCB8990769.1 hypothetical protein [Ardenticatenaceae bacterium]MCB9003256.1 hypothetical protein [Ardenticatenaceae bacterium]
MEESALTLIQALPDTHLQLFAARLCEWLIADLNQSDEPVPDFTESRAKALLRAANVIDDPTLHSFSKLVDWETGSTPETAVRLTLYDLLNETNLADESEVQAIGAAAAHVQTSNPQAPISWLSLTVAAFAWKSEYPLYQLDPAAPPGEYSPAGQLVKRAAFLLRQQVQRSATDRDKLARKLAYSAPQAGPPNLEQMQPDGTIAPLPPYFRPPIPVNYPEMARETLHVSPEENPSPPVERNDPLAITPDELPGNTAQNVTRMPPIRITEDQIRPERPDRSQTAHIRSRVVTPQPNAAASTNFSDNVRQFFGRGREQMKSTKLRVRVTEYPDGPGVYGLQIKVTCKGVRSFVAGTTNRDGKFLCELPVRLNSGLTYDVDITWPRDLGGDTERKSITLHADRTEFVLPFYRKLKNDE